MSDPLTWREIARRHAVGEPLDPLLDAVRDALRSPVCVLDVMEYARGLDDHDRGIPAPDVPTCSYELGRLLGARPPQEIAAVCALVACELEAREVDDAAVELA